ncbi:MULTISPECIES: hypothetical protein [Leptolyngbya]|uniref:hypothetical protein n=1 Tax=Leptolyngbya TaxID=47251 RepID=UPI0003AA5B72|nr:MULTISPECIES: hypothetical protein [Leptolyngbya]MBD2370957.1 hypothetical protein [Leptolyngbya sp. FACHB-161]
MANRFKSLLPQIQDAIETRFIDAAATLQSDTPQDTGKAAGAWDINTRLKGKDIELTIVNDAKTETGQPYGLLALEGRAPGKFPPYGDTSHLARWAKVRGIPPFLVARKIAREGTERFKDGPHHFSQDGQPVEDGAISTAIKLVKQDIQRIKEKS